jgi:hypothetical protein
VVGKLFLRVEVLPAIRGDTLAAQVRSDIEDRVGGIDLAVRLAGVVAVVGVGLLAEAVAEWGVCADASIKT